MTNKTKNFIRSKQKYGIISQNIMRNAHITAVAKALYAYLSGFAGSDNAAFPSRELICFEMNLNKDTFSKYMWELQCWQIITIEKNRGSRGVFENNLYILDHYPEFVMMEPNDFINNIWGDLQELIKSKNHKKKIQKKDAQISASAPCPKIPDTVKNDSPCPDLPDTVQPDPVRPCPVKPDTNNNILNNNILNNNILNNSDILEDSSNSNMESESDDVVVDLDINKISKKFEMCGMPNLPNKVIKILQKYSDDEISKIAETLQSKKNQGKIKNPIGLLTSYPETIDAILDNSFYPDIKNVSKNTKLSNRDYEIYIPPQSIR
jgi:hypothetical protein